VTAAVFDTPAAVAVTVTLVEVVTDPAVAANVAELAPAATVAETGTVTAALLLLRLIANPPAAAAFVSKTVMTTQPAPPAPTRKSATRR
jgi:hypothetical protein